MDLNRDTVFSEPLDRIGDFKFDERVADVFADMISRSVPGYALLIQYIELFAAVFYRRNSRSYDLGCSLGEGALAILRGAGRKDHSIIAIDNSPPMIRKCRALLKQKNADSEINLICADLQDVKIESASIVLMNYTLQFIKKDLRNQVIQKIYDGLLSGGILILSEKLKDSNPQDSGFLIDMYHAFKKAKGYSKLEISQKRTALENVLIPETLEDHLIRLKKCGFRQAVNWLQCFNFFSIVAVK